MDAKATRANFRADERRFGGRRSRVVLVSSFFFEANNTINLSILACILGKKKGTAQTGRSPIVPTSSVYRFGPREAL